MNELRLFEFNERPVRVVMHEGAPWWMAASDPSLIRPRHAWSRG